jgi:hypothetical protein
MTARKRLRTAVARMGKKRHALPFLEVFSYGLLVASFYPLTFLRPKPSASKRKRRAR